MILFYWITFYHLQLIQHQNFYKENLKLKNFFLFFFICIFVLVYGVEDKFYNPGSDIQLR